ncbi:GIY-YIG nuclease family protein [Agrococcus casei]|uniref:Phage protein n=1 Tax=Agrococcus casei LMG 22410 TaxID=1255656 RepID=A0A1R4FGJ4_9MICO|nr:GIY-YIG nuclease family protein [Agrococcus casei]SJM54953.1 Phage protein [Agrococcus casei LMG 22410]
MGYYDREIAELRESLTESLQTANYRALLEVRLTLSRLEEMENPSTPEAPKLSLSPAPTRNVVYYLRWADRVKIGTTKNLRNRTRDIYFDEVLAAEPGGRVLEAQMHRKFASLKIPEYREWFQAGPELVNHAAEVRSKHGAPFKVGKL